MECAHVVYVAEVSLQIALGVEHDDDAFVDTNSAAVHRHANSDKRLIDVFIVLSLDLLHTGHHRSSTTFSDIYTCTAKHGRNIAYAWCR